MLSGGKDSTLAHHHALEQGFTPVAGIVITPQDPESHMFHVPNLDIAQAHIQALNLEPIQITAPHGQETELEALTEAFQQAAAHDVETIVTGAVASEYQRTRIEHAAHNAGLKTHTPLWHKPPSELLHELTHAGYDVRFTHVAAHGLTQDWLGQPLTPERRGTLLALENTHGVHPIGEGGEYETVVLDAPTFNQRIHVQDHAIDWHRDHGRWIINQWTWATTPP